MWGRGSRGNALAWLLAGFQSLAPLPTSKLGHSGADSWVGGFVCILGPCGSPMNSPVRLGVSPAASTPTGFFQSEVLRLYFPVLEPWVAWSISLPRFFLPVYPHANMGLPPLPAYTVSPTWSSSCCLAMCPLHSSCPPPPLLLVGINVSSLTPWLSDFHIVWFSGSSGYFLFLNLLSSCFWLCKEQNVSTYSLHLGRKSLYL